MSILSSSSSADSARGHAARDVHRELLHARIEHLVREQPLFDTRASRNALARGWKGPPRSVFVGIGVASGRTVSRALPFDALGLLLGAEQVRRATCARELIVLVADAHAIDDGAPGDRALARARATTSLVERLGLACGLRSLRVVRASELDADGDYRAALERVRAMAPHDARPYVVREVADMAHFQERCGGIVKVGWALQASPRGVTRDERMFDASFRHWLGRDISVLYCKPGRALDDRHPKMAPYLEQEPTRRVCLDPNEDVRAKLARAHGQVTASTVAGVRKHLGVIARTYGKMVRPLSGTLEQRVQAILNDLLGDGPGLPAGAVPMAAEERGWR